MTAYAWIGLIPYAQKMPPAARKAAKMATADTASVHAPEG